MIYTVVFNTESSEFCPYILFRCCVVLKIKGVISLHSIQKLAFLRKAYCILC
jgi:hypothetical protein